MKIKLTCKTCREVFIRSTFPQSFKCSHCGADDVEIEFVRS